MDYTYDNLSGSPNVQKVLMDIELSTMSNKSISGISWINNELKVKVIGSLDSSDKTKLDDIVNDSLDQYNYGVGGLFENESNDESLTTSGTYQNKLTLNINNMAPGSYMIKWYYEYQGDGFDGKVELDDSEILSNVTTELEGTNILSCCGAMAKELVSGNHKVSIDFCRNGVLGTVMIRRAKLVVHRAT